MKKIFFIFFVGFVCIFFCLASAQQLPVNLRFGKYTTENGLSDNYIYDILKDKKGFLWLCTQNGINRFDGVEFKTFTNNHKDPNSLVNNFVNSITEDSTGKIWAATAGGLSCYNPANGVFKNFIPAKNIYSDSRVYKLITAKDGSIWFSTKKHLNTIDLKTLKIISYPIDSSTTTLKGNAIDNFFEDHNGDFWFDSHFGLCIFDRKSHVVKVMDKIWGLSAFYDDGKGECWMGSWFRGLRNYNFNSKKFIDYYFEKKSDSVVTRDISSIIHISSPETEPYLWIGTDNELAVFNLQTKKFERYYRYKPELPTGLPPGMINKVFYDQRNEMWLATEHGLYTAQLNQFSFQTYLFPEYLTSEITKIIDDEKDSSGLWLSLSPGGLFKINKNTGIISEKYVPEKKMEGGYNYIEDFIQDSNDLFWMSSMYGGVQNFDPISKKSKIIKPALQGKNREDSTIYSLQLIPGNNIEFSSKMGIGIFNIEKKQFTYPDKFRIYSEGNTLLTSAVLLFDDNGTIWLTSANKLYLYNPTTKLNSIMVIDSNNSNSHSICKADNGTIWYTSGDKIFYSNSQGKEFHLLNTDKINSTIYSIICDKQNNIYIGTQTGLIKYERSSTRFIKYTTSDGLYENRMQEGLSNGSNGEIYILGRGYITIINPDKLTKEYLPASLVFEALTIGAKDSLIPFDKYREHALELSADQNQFSVSFRLLHFEDTRNITYFYKLDGWDKNWISSGTGNRISYSNLKGGNYILRVKAFNADGLENPDQATLMIHVESPFWETNLFRILVVGFVFSIIYFIYKIRIRRLMAIQQIRLQISRDLHDEIGSSLSSVHIMSVFAEESTEEKSPDTKLWLSKIGANTKDMIEKVRDIVWTLNSSHETSGNLITRMNQFISQSLEPKEIECTFIVEEKADQLITDFMIKRNLYLIFKEAVNNIAKYSECSKVDITFKIDQNNLLLIIADNGIGFDITNKIKGNGLINMHQRADQIKAVLDIKSSVGAGTILSLRMPLPQLRYWFNNKSN